MESHMLVDNDLKLIENMQASMDKLQTIMQNLAHTAKLKQPKRQVRNSSNSPSLLRDEPDRLTQDRERERKAEIERHKKELDKLAEQVERERSFDVFFNEKEDLEYTSKQDGMKNQGDVKKTFHPIQEPIENTDWSHKFTPVQRDLSYGERLAKDFSERTVGSGARDRHSESPSSGNSHASIIDWIDEVDRERSHLNRSPVDYDAEYGLEQIDLDAPVVYPSPYLDYMYEKDRAKESHVNEPSHKNLNESEQFISCQKYESKGPQPHGEYKMRDHIHDYDLKSNYSRSPESTNKRRKYSQGRGNQSRSPERDHKIKRSSKGHHIKRSIVNSPYQGHKKKHPSPRMSSKTSPNPRTSYEGRNPSDGMNTKSPRTSYEGRNPSDGMNTKSPRTSYEGRNPSDGMNTKSPRTSYEGRNPSDGMNTKSPRTSYEGRNPSDGMDIKSPRIPYERRSPNNRMSPKSPIISYKGRSTNAGINAMSPMTSYKGRSPSHSMRQMRDSQSPGRMHRQNPIEKNRSHTLRSPIPEKYTIKNDNYRPKQKKPKSSLGKSKRFVKSTERRSQRKALSWSDTSSDSSLNKGKITKTKKTCTLNELTSREKYNQTEQKNSQREKMLKESQRIKLKKRLKSHRERDSFSSSDSWSDTWSDSSVEAHDRREDTRRRDRHDDSSSSLTWSSSDCSDATPKRPLTELYYFECGRSIKKSNRGQGPRKTSKKGQMAGAKHLQQNTSYQNGHRNGAGYQWEASPTTLPHHRYGPPPPSANMGYPYWNPPPFGYGPVYQGYSYPALHDWGPRSQHPADPDTPAVGHASCTETSLTTQAGMGISSEIPTVTTTASSASTVTGTSVATPATASTSLENITTTSTSLENTTTTSTSLENTTTTSTSLENTTTTSTSLENTTTTSTSSALSAMVGTCSAKSTSTSASSKVPSLRDMAPKSTNIPKMSLKRESKAENSKSSLASVPKLNNVSKSDKTPVGIVHPNTH